MWANLDIMLEEAARLVGGLEIDYQIVTSRGSSVDQATGLPTLINWDMIEQLRACWPVYVEQMSRAMIDMMNAADRLSVAAIDPSGLGQVMNARFRDISSISSPETVLRLPPSPISHTGPLAGLFEDFTEKFLYFKDRLEVYDDLAERGERFVRRFPINPSPDFNAGLNKARPLYAICYPE